MSNPPPEDLLLLIGGSFNPPHAAHMRMAVESLEILRPRQAFFIPCAQPPHKSGGDLLPFSLRCAMLRAALKNTAAERLIAVSEVENERQGPSYTIETLRIMQSRFPALRPVFVMGSEDYARLHTWLRWGELPASADLAIMPRSPAAEESFEHCSAALWPEAVPIPPPYPGVTRALVLPHGGRLLYLPQPVLEISSTLVRERYRDGRSLDCLIPDGVYTLIRNNADILRRAWGGDATCADSASMSPCEPPCPGEKNSV